MANNLVRMVPTVDLNDLLREYCVQRGFESAESASFSSRVGAYIRDDVCGLGFAPFDDGTQSVCAVELEGWLNEGMSDISDDDQDDRVANLCALVRDLIIGHPGLRIEL